jgi:hypothetical protein
LRLAHRHGPWDCSAVGGAIIGDRVGNADSDRVATTPPAQRCRMVETW